jgi:hypothetical protein
MGMSVADDRDLILLEIEESRKWDKLILQVSDALAGGFRNVPQGQLASEREWGLDIGLQFGLQDELALVALVVGWRRE